MSGRDCAACPFPATCQEFGRCVEDSGTTAPLTPEHDPECIYCKHGPYCLGCPPSGLVDGKVCGPCREAIIRSEIDADPYYRGDYVAMFGDDE